MNDDFLRSFREPPRSEFAKSLYEKLSRERQFAMFASKRAQTTRVLTWAFTALLLAFGLTVLVVPEVRVVLAQFIQTIAGFPYRETEQVTPPKDGTWLESGKVSLPEAQALLPAVNLSVPGWSPEGYVLQEQVDWLGNSIILTWDTEQADNRIWLLIGSVDTLSSRPLPIGPGGAHEVSIDDTPAVLEQGAWDEETGQWVSGQGLALRWQRDDTYYFLFTFSNEVTADELIRMAESIP